MIGRHQGSAVAKARFDGALNVPGGVGIEPEDRAEVEPGRSIEGQPVRLGAGKGLLVRIDLPAPNGSSRTRARNPLRVCVSPSTSKVWW